ncbi:MAG: hypothetical protein NTV80_18730 [Verrucomicrobia bacterium]|nr:hypothetical protein [Verrucomicrobiota bacterium]
MDTNDAVDLKEWGDKAGTLCVDWFPKIAALRKGEYNDALWQKLTGQTVDQLWKQFIETLN